MNKSLVAVVFGLAAIAAVSELGAQTQQGSSSTLPPALAATRAALDKYADPMVAVRDGYFSTVACIEFHPAKNAANGMAHEHMAYRPGAMGVHFLNPANIGATLDSLKPQVLLYEPVGDKLRLVGAEWFVPVAVSKTPPAIFGQTLEGPMEGHQPIMPEGLHHWDLHVWLWKDNPAGVFVPTNAAVKCPTTGYGYSYDDAPPRIVQP
ncbi:MAG TPA: hypothetical protein VKH19_00445 [Gemmatimonadaceae bacterium]|nr:hypothetical protein [Gemmatimonadaceae bacterium]